MEISGRLAWRSCATAANLARHRNATHTIPADVDGVRLLGHEGGARALVLEGPQQHEDLVFIVREHDVAVRVELEDQVVRLVAGAKSEDADAVHAQLPHVLHPPRADVLAKLQREVARMVRGVAGVQARVEAHARFEQKENLFRLLARIWEGQKTHGAFTAYWVEETPSRRHPRGPNVTRLRQPSERA